MEQVFEDTAPNGNRLIINRKVRCANCNAYQVLEYLEDGVLNNITRTTTDGVEFYLCKDKAECSSNRLADQTKVTLITEGSQLIGYKVFTPDGEFLEVEKIAP